jgi:alpha-tubulin suppressor-like RCC1 family protein
MLKSHMLVFRTLILLSLTSCPGLFGNSGGEPLTQISAGNNFSCGLTSSGKGFCWGTNIYGQLGNNSSNNEAHSPVAVAAPKDGNTLLFLSISAGDFHTCGIALSGKAYCWGIAPLGDNTVINSSIPVEVAAPVGENSQEFSNISTSGNIICGIAKSGIAYCWGANSLVPISIAGPNGGDPLKFVTIAVGGTNGHTCGIAIGGTAYCWGDNGYGVLGNGTLDFAAYPTAVASPKGGSPLSFSSISANGGTSCGITVTSEVYCWGNGFSSVPIAIAAPTNGNPLKFKSVSSVGGFYGQTCGLTIDSAAYCWGGDAYNFGTIPTKVGAPSGQNSLTFSSLSSGYGHACGITTSGKAYCWGDNHLGALGDNSINYSLLPVAVAPTP